MSRPLNGDEQALKAKVTAARRRLQLSLDKTEHLVRDLRRRRSEGVDATYRIKVTQLVNQCKHRVERFEKGMYVCECCGLKRSVKDE